MKVMRKLFQSGLGMFDATACIVLVVVGVASWCVPMALATDKGNDKPVVKVYDYKIVDGKPQQIEVHFPPNHDPAKAKVPGMILFHGGAWKAGDLSHFRATCVYFASRGLVCATANYRLATKSAKYGKDKSACIMDGKSAIRWFKQHAGELGIDPDRIITGGASAGGYLSALATFAPGNNDANDPKDVDTSVAAFVWFFPAFSGGNKDPEVDILANMPTNLPPTIVLFGDKDTCKPGWDKVYAKWKSLGIKSIDLWIAPGQGHSYTNQEPWCIVTYMAIDDFLVKQGLLTGKTPLTPPATGEKLVLTP
jgi:acetyl esterase